jgi:glycerol-3-phosphate dehydrogenase
MNATGPPLLSVFGGKITTYRRLAEDAVGRLVEPLGCEQPAWTTQAPLPGGDLPEGSFAVFLRTLERRYPWLPPALRQRLARAYGTRVERILNGAAALADLGRAVLPGLHAREIEYLRREEWARTAEDILWRRTKLGLHLKPESAEELTAWLRRSDTRFVA